LPTRAHPSAQWAPRATARGARGPAGGRSRRAAPGSARGVSRQAARRCGGWDSGSGRRGRWANRRRRRSPRPRARSSRAAPGADEHTSELQSPDHLVCRLLLEKKKKNKKKKYTKTNEQNIDEDK